MLATQAGFNDSRLTKLATGYKYPHIRFPFHGSYQSLNIIGRYFAVRPMLNLHNNAGRLSTKRISIGNNMQWFHSARYGILMLRGTPNNRVVV